MKKSIIFLLSSMIIVAIIFIGCSSKVEEENEIHSDETSTEFVGTYNIFKSYDAESYLNFLENFDDTKFEIVDISTSTHFYTYGSDEFYMVTYRKTE